MAKRLLEGPAESKGNALKGRLQVDTVRGQLRVRNWPSPRGSRATKRQKQMQQWFADCLRLIKRMEPGFLLWCTEVTRRTNIYPRDLAMQLLSGRGVLLVKPDGTTYFPEVFMKDVSLSLDALGQTFGDMLARAAENWEAIPIGTVGQVLTIAAAGELPSWQDPPSGGGGFWWLPQAPLTTDLPTQVIEGGATGVSFTNDAQVGAVLTGAIGNNDYLLAQVTAAPAFPFTIKAHFTVGMQGGVPIAGIVLRNSGSGLRTVYGLDPVGGFGNTIIRRSTHVTFNASLGSFPPRAFGYGLWLAIIAASATDVTYLGSGDGKNWQTIQANTANGQVAADQIGIGLTSRNGATGVATLTCDYWSVT